MLAIAAHAQSGNCRPKKLRRYESGSRTRIVGVYQAAVQKI